MRGRRSERGYAYLLVLGIALMVTMLAMTLITNTTAGIAGEARHYAADRARMNSESGLTLTEFKLKKELPKLLKRVVTEANADDQFGGQMSLSTLRFEPMDYSWGPLPGEGNTAEDTANVRVEITLPGPPIATNTSGLPSGPEVGTVETYCFVAHLMSTGHSISRTKWTTEKVSNVYVTLVLGEIEPDVMSGLNLGNVIEISENDRGDDGPWWDPTPTAYAAGGHITVESATLHPAGQFVLSSGGAPSGGWNGEPQIVSGPTEVGLPNGGSVFYWYVRGLPTGTAFTVAPDDTYGAEGYVLATDGWRFSPSYRSSDDTVPIQQPDGTIVRKKGSPHYAVVAIKSPEGVDGLLAAFNGGIINKTINVPGYGSMRFMAQVLSSHWVPNAVDVRSVSSTPYRVVGWPDIREAIGGYASVSGPTNGSASELDLQVEHVITLQSFIQGISVPGDVPVSDHTVTTNQTAAAAPGQIPLVIVNGRQADVVMSYRSFGSRETVSTRNSAHAISPLGAVDLSGNVIIVDPPPPGGSSRVRIIAIMYVPLWTSYVPDSGSTQPMR